MNIFFIQNEKLSNFVFLQNVTYLEEAFGSVIVYQPNAENVKIQQFCKQLSELFAVGLDLHDIIGLFWKHLNSKCYYFIRVVGTIFSSFSVEQKESALRCYLSLVAAEPKSEQLKNLFHVILQLVNTNVIVAR